MSRPARIYFDAPPRHEDLVTFAIIPIDSVTGAVVGSGVTAKVKGLLDRPVLNRSGMLVFLNLPDPPWEIEIDASEAGYFGPSTLIHPPFGPPDPDPERARRIKALLEPRPDFPFPPATTLVRGVLVRGPAAERGGEIRCKPAGSGTFVAHSTDRGAFALALRLPPAAQFDTRKPVEVDIEVSSGPVLPAKQRILTCKLVSGRSHSFRDPIDLDGNNNPDFFAI